MLRPMNMHDVILGNCLRQRSGQARRKAPSGWPANGEVPHLVAILWDRLRCGYIQHLCAVREGEQATLAHDVSRVQSHPVPTHNQRLAHAARGLVWPTVCGLKAGIYMKDSHSKGRFPLVTR